MENYLVEAFQRLSLLNEEDFNLADRDVVDELQSFVADDVEEIPEEPVIDLDAESEDELADNYVGKVILECECCHTRIYKEESEVIVDEESGLANIEEACPVCNNTLGYSVIGKIEKFEDEPEDDEEEEDDEIDFSDAENDPADEEPVESLRDRLKKRRALGEAKLNEEEVTDPWGGNELPPDDVQLREKKKVCPECGKEPCVCEKCGEEDESLKEDIDRTLDVDTENNLPPHSEFQTEDSARLEDMEDDPVVDESLKEGIENLSMDTDDTHVEMSSTEEGGATVSVEPKVDEPADLDGEEEIVPLSDEEQDDILANEPEDDLDDFADLDFEEEPAEEPVGDELGDEEEPEDEEEEEELPEESLKGSDEDTLIEEFDEVAFNDLCESYLRKVYENVNTFEATRVVDNGSEFIVEGLIKYKNGKTAKSIFRFNEAHETKSGKIVMEGFNETFSKQPKSFKIKGTLENKHYVSEAMAYKYTVRNINEGKIERTKVQGRVKR